MNYDTLSVAEAKANLSDVKPTWKDLQENKTDQHSALQLMLEKEIELLRKRLTAQP